jgi:hypothetical protein
MIESFPSAAASAQWLVEPEGALMPGQNVGFRDQLAELANALLARGVATIRTIQGCTLEQIEEIETDIGIPLPSAYREFLAKMGQRAGRFFVGTDMFYSMLRGLTAAGHELVAEDKSGIALPADAIVFSMHQGYQFLFIRADEGEDPPVYYYMEDSGKFVKKSEGLTQFLLDSAQDEW